MTDYGFLNISKPGNCWFWHFDKTIRIKELCASVGYLEKIF
jgi:hypothetical protein